MAGSDSHDDMTDDVEGKVFIGGLSWQTTEGTLRAHFEKFGELTDVALMIDKRTGQPRGFGFIKLKYPAAADIVVSQEHIIDGRKVDVKKAVPRDRAPAPTRTESRKIFVGGLSAEVSDKIFHDYFSKFGVVKDAVVMVDRSTNRSRGFGFVTFEAEDAVDAVMKTENTILGKWVEVKRAEPRDMNRFDGGSGYAVGGRGAGGSFRGGRAPMMSDGRGRGGFMGAREEYASYGAMAPYGRGYGAGAYPGYGPGPAPYGMQGGYTSAATGYGGYAFPGYGSPGPAGYPAPQAYPRGPTHEGDDGPGSPTMATSHGYSAGTPASASAGYDAYGRGQQYPAYASNAIAGYGGAYGMYGSTPSAGSRNSAQDGYEGQYGAYRQSGSSQSRVERGFKPY